MLGNHLVEKQKLYIQALPLFYYVLHLIAKYASIINKFSNLTNLHKYFNLQLYHIEDCPHICKAGDTCSPKSDGWILK